MFEPVTRITEKKKLTSKTTWWASEIGKLSKHQKHKANKENWHSITLCVYLCSYVRNCVCEHERWRKMTSQLCRNFNTVLATDVNVVICNSHMQRGLEDHWKCYYINKWDNVALSVGHNFKKNTSSVQSRRLYFHQISLCSSATSHFNRGLLESWVHYFILICIFKLVSHRTAELKLKLGNVWGWETNIRL